MPIDVIADRPTILMLEDSPLDAELIREHLEGISPEPVIIRAETRADYIMALDARGFDLILADFSLPDFDGMTALEMAARQVPDVPFIFVSGVLGEEVAIESFRRGATDYVLKQRLIRLRAAVERALAEARDKAEHRRVQQQKELLVRELSHRVKNTMAMVMSLVRRTARNSTDVESYVENLLGRLRAMADAHALLFETNWSEAELADVISRTLRASAGTRRAVRNRERAVRPARSQGIAGAQHGVQRTDDQCREIWCAVERDGADRHRLVHRAGGCRRWQRGS